MLFSLRHQRGLRSGSIKPSFSRNLRRSLYRNLLTYCTPVYDDYDGELAGHEELNRAEDAVLKETGKPELTYPTDGGQSTSGTFAQIVEYGYPSDAMDLIEACLGELGDERRPTAEANLNDALQAHGNQWRLAGGRFVLVDSQYFQEEVHRPALDLLESAGFEGPLREFAEARSALLDGRNRDAVVAANNALESVIKALLHLGRERPGRLIRRLIESGLVPHYHEGFLDSLDKILYSVLAVRSQPGAAHGSGGEVQEIPRECAEFVINLVGALIVLLLRQDADSTSVTPDAGAGPDLPEEDDVPVPWEDDSEEDVPGPWDDE